MQLTVRVSRKNPAENDKGCIAVSRDPLQQEVPQYFCEFVVEYKA